MGLLILGIVLAAVLALAVLVLVAAVIVKLILLVSVPYTLLIVLGTTAYWAIQTHRRRYARGFYSCAKVPSSVTSAPTVCTPTVAAPVERRRAPTWSVTTTAAAATVIEAAPKATPATNKMQNSRTPTTEPEEVTVAEPAVAPTNDEEKEEKVTKQTPVAVSFSLPTAEIAKSVDGDDAAAQLSATESEDEETEENSDSVSTVLSPARGRRAESKPQPSEAALHASHRKIGRRRAISLVDAENKLRVRPESPDSLLTMGPMRRSYDGPNSPASSTSSSSRRGPSSLQGRARRATTTDLSSRKDFQRLQRRKEDVAKQTKSSDGYWIGDFRIQRQPVTLSRRPSTGSQSSQAS